MVLAGIILLALVLHLYKLGNGKGYDEGFTYRNSAYPLKQIIPNLWPDHSPLYFFFSHFTLKLINYSHDLALQRLPSALIGVLIIPALYLLARRTLGNKPALVAAFLAAIAPNLLQLTREFRMYGLFVLLSILSAYFLLEGLNSNKLWGWGGFVLLSVLNLYNHYNALIATFGLGLFGTAWLMTNFGVIFGNSRLVVEKRNWLGSFRKNEFGPKLTLKQTWWRTLGLAVSSGLIFGLYLPWFPHLLNLLHAPGFGPNIDWNKPTNINNFYKYASNSGFGFNLGFWLTLPLAALGSVWLLIKRFYYGLFCLCCFWIMFLVLNSMPGHDNFIDIGRYYSFVTPIYLMLIAQGLAVTTWLGRAIYHSWNSRARLVKDKWQLITYFPAVLVVGLLV